MFATSTCLLLILQLQFESCHCRSWLDVLDPNSINDGMPNHYDSKQHTDWIELHQTHTPLFQELDASFVFTSEPSAVPSAPPSSSPSLDPTNHPTASPSRHPTAMPTTPPTFADASLPPDPSRSYFNYDLSSPYGPNQWGRVRITNDFWHTFDLNTHSNNNYNDCTSGNNQSPIDLCTAPRDSCTETHEMRPKSGDYKMDSNYITKQILSNKLRLIMAPRTGEEPDPPKVDFSSNGKGVMDMTNIDFKFPSEHTVCGRVFDGEMQYYTYHEGRRRFVAVVFFLDASEYYPQNQHLQEVINEFGRVFNADKKKCQEKQRSRQQSQSQSSAYSFAGSGGGNTNDRNLLYDALLDDWFHYDNDVDENDNITFTPYNDDNNDNNNNQTVQNNRRLALKWHPFHPDIQKTVHFWGYKGSITEPPCTDKIVDWKIMDVPTPISMKQLRQFQQLLFNHVDGDCRKTSVHAAPGSVARPIQRNKLKYYKCTRDNYVSDEERGVCGDDGCRVPFGEGLNPYYDPIVDVTGPPTRAPST